MQHSDGRAFVSPCSRMRTLIRRCCIVACCIPAVKPTLFSHEFSLADRVALVSGGNRGLGLEMALALIEAGARAVYCVDLPKHPGKEWTKVKEYASQMKGLPSSGRLEYISADVRDQAAMWKIGETVGDKEGRLDVCVAAAGILKSHTDCLEYPAKQFQEASTYLLLRVRVVTCGMTASHRLVPYRVLRIFQRTAQYCAFLGTQYRSPLHGSI